VSEDGRVRAARFFQRVSQHAEAVAIQMARRQGPLPGTLTDLRYRQPVEKFQVIGRQQSLLVSSLSQCQDDGRQPARFQQ
jgi:hypothetical protein